jgi:hypothetical protein
MATTGASILQASTYPDGRQPGVPTQEPSRVISPSPPTPAHPASAIPAWSPPPKPAGSTHLLPTPVRPPFQATPRRLNFTGPPSPRMEFSSQLQAPIPPPTVPTSLNQVLKQYFLLLLAYVEMYHTSTILSHNIILPLFQHSGCVFR